MTAPDLLLRCAGCGCEGRRSTIIWARSAPEAQTPVLGVVFGWHADGRPALLCASCRKRLQRRARRKPRAAT
jgi:hypothetical protein